KTRHCIAAVAAAVGFTTPSSALVQISKATCIPVPFKWLLLQQQEQDKNMAT
ncbi:unnamed protein product, partial [Ascophyllum nodosum]